MLELSPAYDDREQTFLKHYVLEQYLARFARIIGSWSTSITYVDSFAGPWESHDEQLRDTSFAIAVDCLRGAREWVRQTKHRDLGIRCLFLEKSRERYCRLKDYAERLRADNIEAHALPTDFEAAIPRVVDFIDEGSQTFTFLFIDPMGWTGFALEAIESLLARRPNEVLINFMTGHVRRFIETENTSSGFTRLFGRDIRGDLEGLEGDEREEKAVGAYMRSVKRAGGYLYVGSAIIFKPQIDTPQFHLVYGTRNNKGVKAFKEVEEKLFNVAAETRAHAKERRHLTETSQLTLLHGQDLHPPVTMSARRSRYLMVARDKVRRKLQSSGRIRYELVWRMALGYPLVWESDLRLWIKEWRSAGQVTLPTLTGRRYVPDPERDEIEWIA